MSDMEIYQKHPSEIDGRACRSKRLKEVTSEGPICREGRALCYA
jgi:hypothetical protein